eukprot:05953.XXX_8684_9607_1 [CDS] Oithona nana genome sequencing.
MLATTLMRQQLRCMQNMVIKKPLLTANGSLVGKQQLLATSAVNRSSGDHVRMWTMERGVSVLQIPALIVPFIHTTFLTDAIFCTLAVLHSHWGVEAIVVDYIRPSLFNGSTTIPNIAQGCVWALSIITLAGLYYFNYTDVGIINAIKMLWKL